MDEDEIRDSLLNTNDDEFEYNTESSVNSLDVSDNDIESGKEDNPEALEIDSETEENGSSASQESQNEKVALKSFCIGVDGVKLYPPGGKASSEAWLHGGFKKNEEGQIMKDTFFCKYCNMSLKYLNSPSNLMNHVKEKHRDINQNDVNKQPKISSYISINPCVFYNKINSFCVLVI